MGEIHHLNPNQPTNQILYNMYTEINSFPNALKHLLRPKIQEFFKNNGQRIETIQEGIKKLQDEYFIIIQNQIQMATPLLDDKGQPINPDAPPMPQMQENKTMQDFNDKLQKLMSLTTIIA